MAKLSEEKLERGRKLIRQMDLEGFMEWVDSAGTVIDKKVLRQTMQMCFQARDPGKALRMFESVFPDSDPALERVAVKALKVWKVVKFLFSIGVSILFGYIAYWVLSH